jgi:hypothetical protein
VESNDAGAGTVVGSFDAYGERLADSAHGTIEVAKSRSTALSRIGQGIFWAVVIVIVLARLFYFSAPPVFEMHGVQHPTSRASR